MDDENKLQPNGLWPAPLILSPLSNSTVSPGGFNIVALSPGGVTDSWKIECWGEATDHHGSEDEWAKLEHWVPDTSFDRFGAYFNFKVRYKQVWVWSEWAECHNLYVPQPVPPDPAKPPKPTIYPPPKPASVRESLGIGGVLLNAKVHMYTDRDIPVPGIYVVNTGIFMPTAEWVAGTTRVKVVQILNGMASDPSNLVSVSVGLSRPSIDWPPNPAMGNQTLNITGVETGDVTLRMFTEADALVAGSFTGSGATRVFTPTERWRGGTTVVSVVQTLGGVSSDPSLSVSVRVKPFKPYISLPPNPSSSTQSLEITGVANGDVTLQMSNAADGVVAGSFTGSDSKRTFTPTANWAAGITRVKVVQTVDGMHSDPSGPVSVPVKPSRPSIAEPPKPALGNQTLKISGVVSAVVSLQMYTAANAPVAGSFTGNGDTRIFYPAVNWGGGITVVTVVQSVDGIASDPSAPVPIAVKPSKLTITPPPSPAAAKEPLIITGVSSGVAVLQMSTTGGAPIEGEFAGSGTERTFVSKTGWKPGSTDVWAVQTINGMVSDPSDPVTVSVIEKPPAPVIIQPLPHTVHHADVRVQGTCIAGATITLQSAAGTSLQGELTYDATTWSFEYLWLPGPKHIKAQQSVNGDTSEATAVLEFYIKPATPDIEPPTDPATPKQPLKITGVASGVVTLQMFTQPDRAVPGEFASNGADRLFTPAEDWTSGENTVYVMQTVDGVDSDPSDLCTFTVEVEDRPDAPQFQQPQAGGLTSRYPSLKIAGRPGALQTVRFENGATLHEETAGADGILTFTVVEPLDPGTIVLEAKQASGGTDSDWSAPHRFTVKAAPSTPSIEAPRANSETSRYPRIRGTGATGGEIVLRHALDPKEEFAIVDGSTRWNWTAEKAWPLGDYAVQARQTFDGDWSDWTEARSFKVSESRYAIGDATPAIGTPVVGTEQSVLLRIQVISGVSGEVAAGVEVKWRVNGEEELLATTQTDVNGWTSYRYTPETVGKHDILADVTQDNAGVILTELYEVNAVLDDVWAQAAELYLDGERVDAASELVLLRKNLPYKLELKIADDSVLIGSTVTLQNFWGAKERGLTFNPDLGTPLTINKGSSIHWYISTEEANSGFYGLSLASSILPDWELPGRVEAGDLADAVRFDLDGFPQVFGGAPAYPCLGATHTLTLRPQDSSFLLGQDVVLELSAQAADLGVTLSPSIPQTLGEDGLSWLLNCVDSTSAGDFAVWLKVPALEFSSLELPMSLAHNSAEVSERFGPQQMGGSASFWRYGIRAVSTFTGLPAGGVPVTVAVTGKPTMENVTARDGWIFISYYDGESASLTIRNRYGK
ncbi:hypothetical protein [Pseudomonas siliginis]|uniref:hypothetical protein n=1 Tax=Pseudomonas siliginis TaxID=2842346 RepID=UPI002092081F|nr:hypothetical protein [Pseudomonas siliginis]UST98794.1 hypothetical protein NF680_16485 [Pseudomonas siliginis]